MSTEQLLICIIFPIVGYLLGSIPFAWVIGKAHGVDIRATGSKNIGATNLGRTLGKKYFWQAFLLDAAKGFVPVLAATLVMRYFHDRASIYVDGVAGNGGGGGTSELGFLPMWAPLLTAIACVLGHLFPIWLKFKGGKGVATGFGVVLGFWPLFTLAGLLAGVFFVFMLMVYRYISLASVSAAIAFALFVALLGNWNNRYVPTYLAWHDLLPLLLVAALFALLILFRHRTNLSRLLKGTEPRIGQREIDKAKMK
jgi:glycerol-3-phosphate acyltransferase PlsY